MSPTLIGIVGILIMLAVFMTRMPVAYVMALVGYVGFSFMISGKAGLTLLSRNIYETFSSYGLTTIPLFILMGQLAFNSGIGRRLYDTAYKFIEYPGRFGYGHRERLHRLRSGLRIEPGNCRHHGHCRAAGNEALWICR